MSKELNDKIDAARVQLIDLSGQRVGLGNAAQVRRSYEKLLLDIVNALDVVNAQQDDISQTVMDALKKVIAEAVAKPEGDK